MATPTMTLKADLDDDGVFEEDWSSYLQSMDVALGRKAAVDRFSPRRASFVLDNADSRFSPRNTSGPYSPNLKRNKRVQLAAQVTIAAVTNLLKNPSAETNLTDFAGYLGGTLLRVAAAARFGQFGVETTRGGLGSYGAQQATGAAPSASTYTAAVYVKGTGASVGQGIQITLVATGGAGGSESAPSAAVNLTDSWQRINISLTITAGDHTDLTAIVHRTGAGAGEQFYSDAWQVAQEASASLYCDGDQPACSWSGTAHASISTRTANPTFNIFTGELREFVVERKAMVGRAVFRATGLSERILRTLVSAGPFARNPADVILQRIMDILEGPVAAQLGLDGEVFNDGANRYGGDAIVSENATVDKTYDVAFPAVDDPLVFLSLEGDQVVRVTGLTGTDQGWSLDATSRTTPTKTYRIGVFVRAGNPQTSGQDVRIRLKQGVSVVFSDPVTLSHTEWKYLELFQSFPGLGTGRVVSVLTTGAGWGAGDEFWTDCHHMAEPHPGVSDTPLLPFSTVGTKWTTEIEYLDAFHRSAGALLQELAASVGGWLYEDGDGNFVFEDYSQRDPAVISIPKLRLSDVPEDGFGYELQRYVEPAASLAGKVKVGSFGNVSASPAPSNNQAKIPWRLEPQNIALGANEERTFFADFVSEDEAGSGLIARRAVAVALPISGWAAVQGVTTPWVRNFGRSAEIVIKAPGGGQTIAVLLVAARIQNRQTTERAFVTVGSSDPVMELDMPAQGLRTTAMTNLATWAEAKYSAGPATLEIVVSGLETDELLEIFGRGIGLPVWARHVQGLGALFVDALFYAEGWHVRYEAKRAPRLTLLLEEAA